jgi:hypothetical protein
LPSRRPTSQPSLGLPYFPPLSFKGKMPFKDATLRTNVAGACGLALVRCGEMAFSSLGKESTIISRLHNAISGDSPQDAESLLQVLNDTHARGPR